MKRENIILLGTLSVVVVIIAVVVGGSKSEQTDMQNTAPTQTTQNSNNNKQEAAPNTVIISDFAYSPKKLSVKKGTTVTWTNQDDAHHDITPTSGASDFTTSKLLAKGESHSFTFNQVGSYEYKCSPHPYMKASVEVTE